MEIEDSIMTITQPEEIIIETPFRRKSLSIIWSFFAILIVLLAIRIAHLNVLKNDYYSDISKDNRIRLYAIKAPRGKILDRFGNVLVSNVPSMDVVLIPRYLPEDQSEKQKMAKILTETLNMDLGNVEIILNSQNKKFLDPVLLKENITQEQALILAGKINSLSGVDIENTAIRSYENGIIFAPFIGYDGKITQKELKNNPNYALTDYIGKTGLEKYYEAELKGKNGARKVEVDSMGNIKKDLGVVNSKAGHDLYLNIDEGLQKKIYDSLSAILEKTNTRTAAAVAIDPRNGAVLAMVSLPSYDNNLFSQGISNNDYQKLIKDKNLPLFNRTISGEYPPASTIKPAIAAAALSEGVITPATIIDGSGGIINVGKFSFRDWKVHGPSDVRTAIAESNDIFFYSIGGGYGGIKGLGMDRMKKYLNLFGFGEPTGVDLENESGGLVPSEQWKLDTFGERWYIGNSYHGAIGQGFLKSTPLQVVNYIAAIANNGTLYQPRIVNRIQKSDGASENITPVIIRKDFISAEVMRVIREGMRKTITDGTAQSLKDLPVEVAGKTGTAQFGGEGKTHGWFVSFAPYDNPEIALVVLAEGGGEGSSTGVPVTKDVYAWYFSRSK